MSSQAPESSSIGNVKSSANSSVPWPSFTPTVKGANERLGTGTPVTSLDFVSQILINHSKYAKQKGSQMLRIVDDRRKETGAFSSKLPDQWIKEVTALYSPTRVKDFHGRLFIIGLAMLDQQLRGILNEDGFLTDLIGELAEDPVTLLSDTGKHYFAGLSIDDDIEREDYLKNNDDNPLTNDTQDGLDRAKFARFIVQLLDKTSLKNGAFSIHLYAPWGAGKTSFMNFMKKFLLEEKADAAIHPKWYVIDFNAWQNQSLPYPWWNFMNTIYAQLKDKLPLKYRFREWFWRFKAQRMHQTIALLLICFLLFYSAKVIDTASWLEPFSKLLGALAGIWGIAISLSQNFVKSSQKAAQSYLDSKDNPMADYKKKFNQLVVSLAPAQIAIFIDDLDRCKSAYVVELLESIQTLFKDSNILFVIAADMTWLHASYEVEYDKIKSYIHVEGKTIGPLFIEKMFQLSIALPGVPDNIKERCWAGMLGIESAPPTQQQDQATQAAEATKKAESAAFEKNHQERLDKLDKLATQANMQKTEHYLKPFARFLDLNPRNMKRLLNNYLINKASSLISHIDIDKRQLVLYTILNIQWPVLASFLIKNPECLNKRDQLPDDIADLMRQDEVMAVLEGRGFDDPLTEQTLILCGLLFSCVNYHHFMPKFTQATSPSYPSYEKPQYQTAPPVHSGQQQ